MKTGSNHSTACRRRILVAAALLAGMILTAWPEVSSAYVVTKSTGCSYPNNNWEVKWLNAGIPVTYLINQNGTPDCDDEFNAIQAAHQAWEDECRSTMDFTYGGVTALGTGSWGVNDGNNIIVWAENNWDCLTNNCVDNSNTIAVNTYWYQCADGHLTDSDIIMNGEDYTWSCSGEANKMDVQNVMTHETGHSLSLFDLYGAADAEKTMYGIIINGETKKRTLEQDDRDGIAYLYPSDANERVYLKDADDDYGCKPYTGTTWWNSPDVSLNPDPPVIGQQTTITVRARNLLPTNVQGTVTVEVHDPSVSLSPGVSVLWTSTQNNVNIAPGYSDVTFNWTPAANSFGEGHYCLLAVVKSGNDNTQTGVVQDNNVTCHNFYIVDAASGSGGSQQESVKAGNNGSTTIQVRFVLDRTNLPSDWTAMIYDRYGVPYAEGTPVYLYPYSETWYRLVLIWPASAPPEVVGSVQFIALMDPPPPDRPPIMGGVVFGVHLYDVSGVGTPTAAPSLLRAKAYPNPFNPAVRLALDIPRTGHVAVTIFDATQRRLRTLLDETMPAGHREVVWDGRDASGRMLPSGAYFYQVSLDGERQGGRLLLVK